MLSLGHGYFTRCIPATVVDALADTLADSIFQRILVISNFVSSSAISNDASIHTICGVVVVH
jgi:hypothetical protein